MNSGRKEIFTDLIPNGNIQHDKQIIPIIVRDAVSVHNDNIVDQKLLFDYYYNKTAIEEKTKVQQSGINNKVAIPYANIAVTTINSYCFATPFTRNSRSTDESISDMIKALNDALDDDAYDAKTTECELNGGICGLGYKFVRPPTKEEKERGIWFKTIGDMDPRRTFCVRHNGIDKEKVLGCTFYDKKIYEGGVYKQTVTVYNVYTKYHYWVLYNGGDYDFQIINQKIGNSKYEAYPLVYERIPIIEYPRKQDRTGDFEISVSIIDAINNLASSRVDDVQQAVDYILLLRDIATDTDEDIERITSAIAKGILSFRSIKDAIVQPEVKVLDTKINQSEVQTLQDFLCKKCEEALNIPNRENRGTSGDTGLAVESRAGYRSLENIAGLITVSALKAEVETLDVILAICKTLNGCPFAKLKVKDIEIKPNRNKVENITNASNSYSTLISAGMNDEDALSVTNIVSDPIGVALKNKRAKDEALKQEQALLAKEQKNQNSPKTKNDGEQQ